MPATPTQHPPWMQWLLGAISALLCLLLVCYGWLMYQWPMMREAHYLHYIGYLINEHGFVPYRDILETSWFGTFLFHMLVGNVFGYTAAAFRLADLVFLALLLLLTWRILARLDRWLATIGTITFGLAYYHLGPANTLQRDFLMLLPVSGALLLALQTEWSAGIRALGVGLLFGAACTIKPHIIIGLPPVLLALAASCPATAPRPWRLIEQTGIGGCLMFGCGLGWLWLQGGLAAFLDMTFHYLPLYQAFDGAHHIVSREEKIQQAWRWWTYFTWLWPVTIVGGMILAWRNTTPGTPARTLTWCLPALALAYNLYPLPAGKYWDYHWIPYSYFAILASSLLLFPLQTASRRLQLVSLPALLLFLALAHQLYLPWRGLQDQIQRYPDIAVSSEYEDEIAAFIRSHTPPGEKVQTIDQGGSSPQWLLKAGSVLATPYLGSFMFLHHLDAPYVQQAQKRFLALLQEKPPALIIVMADFTRPHGPNTREDIPGFRDFLVQHYHPIRERAQYSIWERNQDVSAAGSPGAPPPATGSVQANPQ